MSYRRWFYNVLVFWVSFIVITLSTVRSIDAACYCHDACNIVHRYRQAQCAVAGLEKLKAEMTETGQITSYRLSVVERRKKHI
jgi:hypothetical protein